MAEPAIIKLQDPVTRQDGDVLDEITLRPPTLGDRAFLDKLGLTGTADGKAELGPWASTAYTAACRLGALAPATAEQLSAADAMQVYTAVMGFIGGSQTIGAME